MVRAHATDIDAVMKAALPLYSNIDTMFKWNGESLTWTNVRGPVLDRFKMLAESSNVAIANMHLLSNLEPFRWGDPDFIRQTETNFQRIGIEGLHLYPLRYWDWPYAGDNTQPPLLQTDRDWIWFAAWGRYAWNPNRDPEKEHALLGGAVRGEIWLGGGRRKNPRRLYAGRTLPAEAAAAHRDYRRESPGVHAGHDDAAIDRPRRVSIPR